MTNKYYVSVGGVTSTVAHDHYSDAADSASRINVELRGPVEEQDDDNDYQIATVVTVTGGSQ